MINRNLIGQSLGRKQVTVYEDDLKLYARAIGESNPIYFDVYSARAVGYRSIPVLPTFLSCMEARIFSAKSLIELTGLAHARILHAEQEYQCNATACADDVLFYEPRIVDVYDKKNGELEFLVKKTTVTRSDGVHIADLIATLIHRK